MSEEEREDERHPVFRHGSRHARFDHPRHRDLMELRERLAGRGNVVMTRLNDDNLAKIDALVEVEVFKSRSEAAAFFIKEGMQARGDIFEKVMQTVEEIKQLKEKARSTLSKTALSNPT